MKGRISKKWRGFELKFRFCFDKKVNSFRIFYFEIQKCSRNIRYHISSIFL